MSVHIAEKQLQIAEKFVEEEFKNDKQADVNLEQFWTDQEASLKDTFSFSNPQMPLGAICNWECVFAELGFEQDHKKYNEDFEYRKMLHTEYNKKSLAIVGKKLLPELTEKPNTDNFQYPLTLWQLFEMENVWDEGSQSWWLKEKVHNTGELSNLLDKVEKKLETPKETLFPSGWEKTKKYLLDNNKPLPLYQGQRGPVTFAMSLYGVENIIFLLMDEPELAKRLSKVILKSMITMHEEYYKEAGYTKENFPHGFGFYDDNCAMLNEEMYEMFGLPVLQGMFDAASPNDGDRRYQHSDSDMEQLLPALAKAKLNGVNFGPNLSAKTIREKMPNAVIHGQLAPFTYSRCEYVNMVAELLRDFEATRDTRGLIFSTAGSINNGSSLRGMRLLMSAIQKLCRY